MISPILALQTMTVPCWLDLVDEKFLGISWIHGLSIQYTESLIRRLCIKNIMKG